MRDDAGSLRDEVAMLRASLDDARTEHARGDIDDAGLARIVDRDEPRLARAQERLAALDTTVVPAGGRATVGSSRRMRRLAAAAGALALAAVLVLAVVQPFSRAKAAPPLTAQDKVVLLLTAAEVELAHNRPLRALTLYDAVLRLDPTSPEALAESGWLRYEHALGTHNRAEAVLAERQLVRATQLVPREAAAHLYLGIVLWQRHHERRAALAQLWRAAALRESPVEQSLTAQFIALLKRS